MPKEVKIEIIFSEVQWEKVQKSFKEYMRIERLKGYQFSKEDVTSAFGFTYMCEEWLKQQNRYKIWKDFFNDIQRS